MRVYKFLKDGYLGFSRPVQVFFQCWLFILVVLVSTLIYSCLQVLLAATMRFVWADTNNLILTTLVGFVIITLIYVGIVPFMNQHQYPRAKSDICKWSFWLETAGWLVFVKVFQALLASATPTHVNTTNQETINRIFYSGHVNEIFIILLGVLMAPLIEEFIYRWLAFRIITIPWLAYILGALGFTLLHCPQSFIAFLIYLSMAIALETSFYRKGFWGSYALHFLINLTAVIVMLKI